MMNGGKTWVILAESSRARIFTLDKLYSPLEELEGFVNNNCRLHKTELISDKPGHAFDSRGYSSHRLTHQNTSKQHEADMFAKTLAIRLERARLELEYEKLIVIASPAFLGLLRKHLSQSVKQCLLLAMAKNIVKSDTEKLRMILNNQLPGAYKISTRD